MKILAIDARQDVLSALQRAMTKSGDVLAIENDPMRGLELAQQNRFDLILLDIQMPGMDGFEVCDRLKTDVRTSGVPVIFITGSAGRDGKSQAMEAGAIDFLLKPFDVKSLYRCILVWKLEQSLKFSAQPV